eukprot:67761-Chlamydomonas_euryale.AAC.1
MPLCRPAARAALPTPAHMPLCRPGRACRVCYRSVGVSSQPEHSVVELDPSHKFMILASDGVWEFINSAEAVDIVRQFESIDEACRAVR